MTVNGWVREAVRAARDRGATVREVQRWIDEHHGEELAVATIEASLTQQTEEGTLTRTGPGRWTLAAKTTKADALRRLFGE